MSSASELTPSTKSSPDNGYTVSSSFFSKITETFRPTTQKENSVPENIKPSRSDNQEEEPQLEYDDDHEMFATPTPELERRDGAKKAMKYNAILSMAKLKKKYKMKKMKLKYKLARDKMKYKYKTQALKYHKPCGRSCQMSLPQLVNFQKISYKKVPVPVHHKLYKQMLRRGGVPFAEPEGFGGGFSGGFGGGYGDQVMAESEPESWYGSPLGGIPEPYPEIAFPLPEPEIHFNKKFVEYKYLDDYGGGQDPTYIYEEYYDDPTPAPTSGSLVDMIP